MKPNVSIIVAAWDGDKYIGETLKSLLNQSEKDIEVLVVDDGSTDRTAEIVKSYRDPRVQYFYQENSGSQASPRNKGIKEARGDFVGFCDQDDLWYKNKIQKQIAAYENSSERDNIGIIISSADLISAEGKKLGTTEVPFEGFLRQEESREKLLAGDFITACSALIPKKVLDEVGLLDEGLAGVDDYDLFLRISEKYGIVAMSEQLCAWRQSESSFSADKEKQYIETEKIFQKIEPKDKSEAVLVGHGKNLTRIFLSLVLDKKFNEAKKYRTKINDYTVSKKTQWILSIFDLSFQVCYWFLVFLKSIGRVSL